MRASSLQRIVAPLTAAVLLGSGSAQAILLLGCGERSMKSCCCPKGDPAAAQPARLAASERACCSVTPAPARTEEATPQATAAQIAPALIAVAEVPLPGAALLPAVAPRALDGPRSAGPPILRTTCSLLI